MTERQKHLLGWLAAALFIVAYAAAVGGPR